MAHERWVFPLDCPDCQSSSGYPYEATTVQGNRTAVRIGLRCRNCRHEWLLQLETDPLGDPDRGARRGKE